MREELQLAFGRHSMLSSDDFAYIYRATRAATMAEEWLHQFGDVLHAGTPAINEADNYAAFLRARYLT